MYVTAASAPGLEIKKNDPEKGLFGAFGVFLKLSVGPIRRETELSPCSDPVEICHATERSKAEINNAKRQQLSEPPAVFPHFPDIFPLRTKKVAAVNKNCDLNKKRERGR